MKKIALAAVVAALTASTAFAGGPVVVEPDPAPAVVLAPASSGSMGGGAALAALAGIALVAALASNSSGSHNSGN
ncbi:MAG: hypothetical protein LBE86_12050 [Gemmobacter sp.]|nr:hypothetical protein [Gemmobacter sp.]